MRKLILLIVVILLSVVSVAFAEDAGGWHKSKWNMKLEELQKIYNNELMPISSGELEKYDNQYQYYLPSFKIGDFDFTVAFAFDNNMLSMVMLQYENYEKCHDCFRFIEDSMIKKYGMYSDKHDEEQDIGFGFFSTAGRDWVTASTNIHLSRSIMVTQTKSGIVRITYKSRASGPLEKI